LIVYSRQCRSPPHLYTLSLHDALPISSSCTDSQTADASSTRSAASAWAATRTHRSSTGTVRRTTSRICSSPTADRSSPTRTRTRSEEHTSELQSHLNLVCRLLLEKKNE